MSLLDTVTDISLDNQGRLVSIGGMGRAKDFKKMVVNNGNRTKQ